MKSNLSELFTILKQISPIENFDAIKEDTLFYNIPLDSMDIAAFFLEVEEYYNVKIANKDFNSLDTLRKLCDYINKL